MQNRIGLNEAEVAQRRKSGLGNTVTASSGLSETQIILRHCLTYFNFIFIILAVILAISGSGIKNMTFMVVVVLNTAIGIIQQIRAKRAVDKLTLVAAQQVKVLRDGQWVTVRSDLLVQDDVAEFSAGDQICADGTVLSGTMQVNEALLTGEADGISKGPDQDVLSGSFVISGTAQVLLTRVGDHSFAAKLAREAKANPEATKSGMMRALDKLIWVMGGLLIPVGILLFYQEFFVLQQGLRSSSESTVAALVGMIPEGLYLLTSVAMAASALKLTRQRVLVQDMNCIEALARVDVLCVDKTGTITEPVMALEKLIPLGDAKEESLSPILQALYGSASPDNETAKALQAAYPGESTLTCTQYVPFDSRYKWCGGTFRDQGSFLVGAPERIMGENFQSIRSQTESWTGKGYRVLLLASSPEVLAPDGTLPRAVTPLALLLLTNRIRETAPDTFRYFREQGVAVKVISGDNPLTVSEVAHRAGIPDADQYIDGTTLQDDEAIQNAAKKYTVFGRVTPELKKKLILAFKKEKHTVAMTGDGVNDVLAMKESNCGVAMAGGAQAASQVARLVLMDSDFAAMPGIVAEGRRVINNIQRAAALFLVKNILSLGLAVICVITGWSYPFQPFHLSVVSALTIGVPGFFLAMEPNYAMIRGKFLPTVLRQALPGGLTNIIVTVLAYLFMRHFGLPQSDCATVCTAVLSVVGLMVLFQVSQPMSGFRKLILCSMAAALLGSFLLLGTPFDLTIQNPQSLLVMAVAICGAVAVFFTVSAVLRLLDHKKC